jgi:hypothetical protein
VQKQPGARDRNDEAANVRHECGPD